MGNATTPPPPPTPRVLQLEEGHPTVAVAPGWSCPPWCSGPLGHGFENSSTALHDNTRQHEHLVWDCEMASSMSASVYVSQEEVIVAGGSGGIWRGPMHTYLLIEGIRLTSSATRALAAVLVETADYLDAANAEAAR